MIYFFYIIYYIYMFVKLSFRMKFFVDFAQLFVSDVGVDLGGGNVGMTEHHLDTADVCTVGKEISRERVAEDMWRHFF